MRRYVKIIGTLAAIIVICVTGTVAFIAYRMEHPRLKRTVDSESEWQHRHLSERFSGVFPSENGVHLVDSWFGNHNANVSIGYSFTEPGDDGKFRTYMVSQIEEDGVLIDYVSHFDHRTWGKWLIEEDTGTVKLKWKKQQ